MRHDTCVAVSNVLFANGQTGVWQLPRTDQLLIVGMAVVRSWSWVSSGDAPCPQALGQESDSDCGFFATSILETAMATTAAYVDAHACPQSGIPFKVATDLSRKRIVRQLYLIGDPF